jgi:Dyp-type peroxidase family
VIEEPILELDDIQGDICPGFKKDSQHFVFLQITDPALAKGWLKKLAPRLWNAQQVLAAHGLWKQMRRQLGYEPNNLNFLLLNCAISFAGLKKLGLPDLDQFDDAAFKLGLEARAAGIGDPSPGSGLPGAPETWQFGSGNRRPDVLLVIASDDLDWVMRSEAELVDSAIGQGFTLLHVDRGLVRPGALAGHEHFGFKDGISQPAIRGRQSAAVEDFLEPRTWPADPAFDSDRIRFAAPGRPLVWPGHFLFGYLGQKRDKPEEARPNSEPVGPSWAKNGSFLVYRRLAQEVDRFQGFLKNASETLRQSGFDPTITPERLGALLVGRWPSGWPIMRDSLQDPGPQPLGENYFRFSQATTAALPDDLLPLNQADPNGAICPFAGHIRKVNPRDDKTDIGNQERTFQKLLLRRGITFGPEIEADPQAERGLLFVAFQASIVNQFEFLMNDWVNEADKPHAQGGIDPILSNVPQAKVRLLNSAQETELPIPGQWVIPTGGEYFFTPGLRFFKEVL